MRGHPVPALLYTPLKVFYNQRISPVGGGYWEPQKEAEGRH